MLFSLTHRNFIRSVDEAFTSLFSLFVIGHVDCAPVLRFLRITLKDTHMYLHHADDQQRGTINSSLKCAKTGCDRGKELFTIPYSVFSIRRVKIQNIIR